MRMSARADEEKVRPPALPLAGVELGGTKCIVTLARGPDQVLEQRTVPTTQPEETIPAIAAVLREWWLATGFRALGIASFGPLDLGPGSRRYGQILDTNKPGWAGTDVLHLMSAPFDVPVGFDTDVNGAARAEMRWGCARGLDDFAYVTVGTGVGVGLIVNGCPTRGIGHSEIGHLRVPRTPGDGHASVCGYHPDCVEGLASGTALVARVGRGRVHQIAPDDPVWDPIVDALAAMCHALVCMAGPQRIVIGGGVPTGQPHLLERIERRLIESLNDYLKLPASGPYIVPPLLGVSAGPLGSIAIALDAFENPQEATAAGQR